ncbi:TPA: hypothetical protein HA265_01280, partial [Candidatus Woesearchaeota archaeon]|nr:hypothetical protein [Candidatus Woesearchaeota archaeon]
MKKEAEEESTNWVSLIFGSMFNVIKEFLLQGIMSKVDQEVDSIMAKFQCVLERFERKFMQNFALLALVLSGIFFILLGMV